MGAEADAACCLFLWSKGELPPLLRNLLDREAVARERKLPVGVPDGLAVRALRKTPHKAGHGLKEAVRADASNSARHTARCRGSRGGRTSDRLRKRLRRPELAAELPEIIRLVHLRVVDDHLRSRPREVGFTRSVVFKMGGEGTAGLHGGSESGNRSVLCFLYHFFQMIKDHYFSKLARNDPLHYPVSFPG